MWGTRPRAMSVSGAHIDETHTHMRRARRHCTDFLYHSLAACVLARLQRAYLIDQGSRFGVERVPEAHAVRRGVESWRKRRISVSESINGRSPVITFYTGQLANDVLILCLRMCNGHHLHREQDLCNGRRQGYTDRLPTTGRYAPRREAEPATDE